jgi:hypothetical protein
MLLARVVRCCVNQELSCAFGARVTYLLRGQEISTQQRRPPHLALATPRATAPALPQLGHPCPRHGRQVREAGPGFSTGLLSGRKGADIPVGSPAGLSSPPHRRTGAPVEQQGHPGPHSVRSRCAVARAEEPRAKKSRFERDFPWLRMSQFGQEETVGSFCQANAFTFQPTGYPENVDYCRTARSV